MAPKIAELPDLDDLLGLAVEFRDHLQRSHPDDARLRDNLRRLISTSDAEFYLAVDEAGRGVGYIQQRYRYSLWLSGLEACLEDVKAVPQTGVTRAPEDLTCSRLSAEVPIDLCARTPGDLKTSFTGYPLQ